MPFSHRGHRDHRREPKTENWAHEKGKPERKGPPPLHAFYCPFPSRLSDPFFLCALKAQYLRPKLLCPKRVLHAWRGYLWLVMFLVLLCSEIGFLHRFVVANFVRRPAGNDFTV